MVYSNKVSMNFTSPASKSRASTKSKSSKSVTLQENAGNGEEAEVKEEEVEWAEEDLVIERSGEPEILENRMLPKGELPPGRIS